MIASLTDMLRELNKTDTIQINNIKSLIPHLATNGMIAQTSQMLSNITFSPNSWTTAPITISSPTLSPPKTTTTTALNSDSETKTNKAPSIKSSSTTSSTRTNPY